jgi:hypothetical protein
VGSECGYVIITHRGREAFQLYNLAIYCLLNPSTKSYFQCESESTPRCDYNVFRHNVIQNSVLYFSV